MAKPARQQGGRAPPVVFAVFVVVPVAAGILIFIAFLGPHLIGSIT